MKRPVRVIVLLLVFLLALSGCRSEWVWSFGRKVALSNGREGLTEDEIRVIALEYKCLFDSYYKELLGERFWEREVSEGETYEEYIKSEYILEEARALLFLNSVAGEHRVSLTDAERAGLRKAAGTYYGALTEDERAFLSSGSDTVEAVLSKYLIASKVVNELVRDRKLEVSDEESRVSDIMVIRVRDGEEAWDLYERIRNGENFSTLAHLYSEDERVDYSVARSELTDEIRSVVFSLKDGEISPVIEYRGEYYLFRNVSSYNVLLSNKEKSNLLAARRYENWNELYRKFSDEHEEKLQLSFWNALRLNETGDFPHRIGLFTALSE